MERDRKERPRGQETPGQIAIRLINQTVQHTLDLETHRHDPNSEAYQQAQAGLVSNRDEFKAKILKGDNWDETRKWWFGERVISKLERKHLEQRESRRDARFASNVVEVFNAQKVKVK